MSDTTLRTIDIPRLRRAVERYLPFALDGLGSFAPHERAGVFLELVRFAAGVDTPAMASQPSDGHSASETAVSSVEDHR